MDLTHVCLLAVVVMCLLEDRGNSLTAYEQISFSEMVLLGAQSVVFIMP